MGGRTDRTIFSENAHVATISSCPGANGTNYGMAFPWAGQVGDEPPSVGDEWRNDDRLFRMISSCLDGAGRVMSARRRAHEYTTLRQLSMRLTRRVILFVALSSFVSTAFSASPEGESRYFRSSDGVRLHYLEAGQGPVIVFVPGWTMPAEIWAPQFRHFAKSYRVIALDPRGQGRSEIAREGYVAERRARDLAELIDRIGEPVVLVGWSLGVLDSLTYVDNVGTERVRALVLVDNSIGEEPPPSSDPTFFKRLRTNRSATIERFVRGMYRTPQDEAYLQRMVAASLRVPLDASIALLSYPYPRQHWKEIVYRTDRPLLYAVSARFSGQAGNLKKNRPNAWVKVFENAGHALFVDEAEAFNLLLEDFLSTEVPLPTSDNKKEGK